MGNSPQTTSTAEDPGSGPVPAREPSNPASPAQPPSVPPGETGFRIPIIWVLALALLASGAWVAVRRFGGPSPRLPLEAYRRSVMLADRGILLVPESERSMRRVVMGIGQAAGSYYLLPPLTDPPGVASQRLDVIRKSMYWLDLELAHGDIWNLLPPDSQLFIAVPMDANGKTSRRERDWFREYLHLRWSWDDQALKGRIHYFDVPAPVIWGQDIGEVVGRDLQGRTVIAVGRDEPGYYRDAVLNLVKAYPDDFSGVDPGPGVSTEGGDIELVWGAGDKPEVLAGRFAAIRYLQRIRGSFPATQAASLSDVAQARSAFSRGFFGLPVRFLPESVLQDPARGNPELFHLDMMLSTLADSPRPRAFIPTYLPGARDATGWGPLKPEFVRSLQREYDRLALEMSSFGYNVVRLPFADHPVRSPANLVKCYDPIRKVEVVYLSKYPNHLPDHGKATTQDLIRSTIANLQPAYGAWLAQPNDGNFANLMGAFQQVWTELGVSATEVNPIFEAQKKLVEKCGYRVVPVPMYVWGAGGLHCLILH